MNLESLGEMLASKLIGQDPMTGEISQPKAHDSIDSIIKESISPEHQIILSDILENIATGGMGGTLKTGLKATKSIAGSDFLQKLLNKLNKRWGRTPVSKLGPIAEKARRLTDKTGSQFYPPTNVKFYTPHHASRDFKKWYDDIINKASSGSAISQNFVREKLVKQLDDNFQRLKLQKWLEK